MLAFKMSNRVWNSPLLRKTVEKHIPGSTGEVCEENKTLSKKNICTWQAQFFSGKPTIELVIHGLGAHFTATHCCL